MNNLPPLLVLHIHNFIEKNGHAVLTAIGDPCEGCPMSAEQHAQTQCRPDICYQCPLWGLRVDIATLALFRRLEGGTVSDKA